MGSGRQLFYESLQYRHTQKPIALLCDSKRDQVSPMNPKIRIRFIIGFCHFPPKNKPQESYVFSFLSWDS